MKKIYVFLDSRFMTMIYLIIHDWVEKQNQFKSVWTLAFFLALWFKQCRVFMKIRIGLEMTSLFLLMKVNSFLIKVVMMNESHSDEPKDMKFILLFELIFHHSHYTLRIISKNSKGVSLQSSGCQKISLLPRKVSFLLVVEKLWSACNSHILRHACRDGPTLRV
jgi:hypothetical protein